MLQSTRNKETLSILQRLRKQGAPSGTGTNLGPLMGEEDVDGNEADIDAEVDPNGSLVESPLLPKKKRRLRASGAGGEY